MARGDSGGSEAMEARGRGRGMVVLLPLPLPLQGHLNPMFQLAHLLHSQGFSVTVLHHAHLDLAQQQHPGIRLLPIPASSQRPEEAADVVQWIIALNEEIIALNEGITAPLRERLQALMSGEEPIACFVNDAMMYRASEAAHQLGLPRVVLRTGSAFCFRVFAAFPLLRSNAHLPIRDPQSNEPVPELPPFRVRDLPHFEMCNPENTYEVVTQCVEHAKGARAMIMNTFEALESADILKLQQELEMPIFPVGPLHKLSPDTQSSLLIQDRTCIEWLDRMAPLSVLYVSFGSLACMSKEEVLETAWGLANSQQPFLWVLRPGSVKGSAGAVQLPEDFLAEIGERGRVVEWAPQQEVLRHRAIGGFWSHCGWNSTLESICEGVPMLCWPYFGDQMVNARVIDHVWKVGITMEKLLKRDEIESAVRMLMVGEEGREMRKRAAIMKAEADLCIKEGGSSYLHLEKLVQFILSLK